jgi:hypothetical protein
MTPKKLLSAALITGSLFLTGVAAAVPLTLTPTNPNPGCTDLGGGACGAVGTSPQFNTDNATTQYSGKLDIAAASGATTFAEAGNLRIVSFQLLGLTQASGVDRQSGGNYDIYATYTTTGTGTWVGPTTFLTTSVNTLNVTLYASPSSGTQVVLGNVASGASLAGAFTPGSQDFILGTASLIASGANVGIASYDSTTGAASTSLQALLNFNPAPGTTGVNGFFTAPIPFVITIGAQAGGNPNNTTAAPNGGGIRITTNINNPGGGSLAFTAAAIPEPGALSLVGIALLGLSAVGRRKSKTVA